MTLRVLLAIRTAAIIATIVLLFVAWLAPAWNARFVIVARRVAVTGGLGAQFAMTGIAVARGREPWTRFVIPVVAAILTIEALATHALPLWSFGVVGAIEASIVTWVVVSTLRDTRGRDAYPEERFARAFARVADPLVARFLAVETTVMGAALRFLGGGFRQPLPAGFGFTKTASSLPLLLAIPQAYWPWRVFDDFANIYAMVWGIGLYATFRTRPHRIIGNTLHLAFGVFRTAEIPLAHIAAAHVTRTNFDPKAWSRAHRTDGLSFAVDGTPVVIFNLSVPLARAHRGETREIACVAVSCDDAFALARATARPT